MLLLLLLLLLVVVLPPMLLLQLRIQIALECSSVGPKAAGATSSRNKNKKLSFSPARSLARSALPLERARERRNQIPRGGARLKSEPPFLRQPLFILSLAAPGSSSCCFKATNCALVLSPEPAQF